MSFNAESRHRWEHIINDVDVTEVPLSCIKKVIIKLENRRQKTINFHALRKQGLNLDQIENIMTDSFMEFDNKIQDVDFVVDIEAVAELIQPETDKLLKNI